MTRMERRAIREQEHKFKFVKINKRLVSVGLTTLIAVGIVGLSEGVEASASEWRATTVEEMKTKVKVEDGKYTFQSGDTFYAIGEAINIRYEKLMEWNGYTQGTEYSIPVGTVITWNGDHITITDPQGNVIKDTTVQPSDKVNPEKPVGSNSVNQNSSSAKGNQGSSNTGNGSTIKNSEENKGSNNNGNQENGTNGGTVTPTPNPEKPNPVDPNKPTEPEQSELEKLKAKLADLKQQLAVAQQELSQAQQELNNAKSDTTKEEIQNKINEQQTIIDSAQATITTKQVEVASLDSQLSVANTDLTTAQNNLATIQSSVNNAQSAVNTAQANLSSAQTALEADPTNTALQQAVTDAKTALSTANSELSTAQSNVANAKTAVNTAQSTIASLNASKAQANSELSTAQNTLTTAQTQKEALEQQLNNAGNNNIADLEAKVKEKQKVVADLEAEIKEVEKKIAELEGQEKPKPEVVDKTGLQNLVNNVKATDTSKYTDETVKVFNSALSTANTVLSNAKATQNEVNTALSNLQTAFNNLVEKSEENKVDKTALESLINSLKDIDLSVYTDDSVEKFNEALSNAYNVFWNEKSTQSEVDSAVSALETAHKNLEEKEDPTPTPTTDKTQLNLVVSEASSIHLDDYTIDSAKALSNALSKAKEVLSNAKATQEQVNEAKDNLRTAIDNLVEKPETPKVDKSALQSAVDSVSSLKQSNYTSTSWTKLQTALTNAKQILNDKDATQSQVDAQVTALNNAKSALVKKANKTALDQAIAKAPLAQGSYTDTSWKALQSALSTAKTISGKEDATQSEVDSATTALNKAINDLKVQKYTLTVIHKDESGKVLDTETFEVEKGKNYSAKSKGFEGYELVGEGTKVVTNMQSDGTVTFTYKKKQTQEEQVKETINTVNSSALDVWKDYRQENGKTATIDNEILQKMADKRAKELEQLFDHVRPNGDDYTTIEDDFDYFETNSKYEVVRALGSENIAKIQGVTLEWLNENGGEYIMNMWKNSGGHNANLLLDGTGKIKMNQASIGTHLVDRGDGTYDVYVVALIGYDTRL